MLCYFSIQKYCIRWVLGMRLNDIENKLTTKTNFGIASCVSVSSLNVVYVKFNRLRL